MALRFNVPPNWPEPPEGWVPQPGWQPDPAWGPAPAGWVFWVEDEQTSPLQDDATTAGSTPAGEDPTPTIPLSDHSAGPTRPTHTTQGAPHQLQGNYAGTSSSSPQQAAPQGNYQGNYRVNYPGQSSYQQPYAQGSPYAQPAKKSFFKSTAGILTIIGVVLLALIVAVVLIAGALFNAVSSSLSSNSYSDSIEALRDDAQTQDFSNADRGSTSGDVIEYSGSGEGLLDVSARNDSDKPAWVEFEYQPETSSYSSITLEGQDAYGESSDVFVLSGREGDETVKGSFWMDTESYYEPTHTITVTSQGKWVIRVHPLSDAPEYGKGDSLRGTASTAFRYKGGEGEIKVKFTTTEGNSDSFTLKAYDADYEGLSGFAYGSGSEHKSTYPIDFPDQTLMLMENSFSGSWEISFE